MTPITQLTKKTKNKNLDKGVSKGLGVDQTKVY
jgi:hypothetical protein